VTIEDRDAVLSALMALEAGMDLADALHVARSTRASAFVTVDRQLARRAKASALSPPVELLN
jgi:predicted nucleic acid-binding protein